jgi:hypothetical protein
MENLPSILLIIFIFYVILEYGFKWWLVILLLLALWLLKYKYIPKESDELLKVQIENTKTGTELMKQNLNLIKMQSLVMARSINQQIS